MESVRLPHDHGHPMPHPAHTPDTEDFNLLADVFKLLGDASRVRIFWLLCHCEACVINLSAMTEMSSPALSHHLKLLKAARLITSRREGKEVYYTAAHSDTAEALHRMIEKMIRITCPDEEALTADS